MQDFPPFFLFFFISSAISPIPLLLAHWDVALSLFIVFPFTHTTDPTLSARARCPFFSSFYFISSSLLLLVRAPVSPALPYSPWNFLAFALSPPLTRFLFFLGFWTFFRRASLRSFSLVSLPSFIFSRP